MTTEAWPCHSVAMPIEIGDVRGVTSNVGADAVVFASDVSFAVGSSISFIISTPAETAAPVRLECRGVVTHQQEIPGGGYEIAATIDSVHIVPIEIDSTQRTTA
jgi:hypothetical protein